MLGRFSQPPGVFGSASLGQLPVASGEVVPEFSFKPGVLALGTIGLSTNFALGSLVGGATFTDTRSTTGTFQDWEYPTSPPRTALVNEARFNGLRRVQNILGTTSEDFTNAAWTKTTATVASGAADPNGGNSAYTLTATAGGGSAGIQQTINGRSVGDVNVGSIWMRRRTGTGQIRIGSSVGIADITAVLTSAWQRFSVPATLTGTQAVFFVLITTNADAVDIWRAQLEPITGQSNQNPGEYVSVGVLSSPWNGAGVDAVRYFTTQNGNTVTANVVTAGTGAALPGPTPVYWLTEPAATNYFQNASAPATHTTSGNLPLGTYTLWIDGTGTIAVAGATGVITGAGTASSGVNVTFTVTVSGTVAFTVVGSPTRAQAEGTPSGVTLGRSSFIDTTTAAVIRQSDFPAVASTSVSSTVGSVQIKGVPLSAVGVNARFCSGETGGTGVPLFANSNLSGFDGTNTATVAATYVVGTSLNMVSAWDATGLRVAKDGSGGTLASFDGNISIGTTLTFMRASDGSNNGPTFGITAINLATAAPATAATVST